MQKRKMRNVLTMEEIIVKAANSFKNTPPCPGSKTFGKRKIHLLEKLRKTLKH